MSDQSSRTCCTNEAKLPNHIWTRIGRKPGETQPEGGLPYEWGINWGFKENGYIYLYTLASPSIQFVNQCYMPRRTNQRRTIEQATHSSLLPKAVEIVARMALLVSVSELDFFGILFPSGSRVGLRPVESQCEGEGVG